MPLSRPLLAFAPLLALAACTQAAEDPASEEEPATIEVEGPEPVSILRPSGDGVEAPQAQLEPLQVTIGFPDGGSELDADAVAALEGVLESEQLALGLPITLRAHSDSPGTDTSNLDASEERGLAVAAWLIEKGVDPDRIAVIAFGEQNPVEPNAKPDGSPNEEGRAANRRVEIEVAAMALTISATDDGGSEPASAESSD